MRYRFTLVPPRLCRGWDIRPYLGFKPDRVALEPSSTHGPRCIGAQSRVGSGLFKCGSRCSAVRGPTRSIRRSLQFQRSDAVCHYSLWRRNLGNFAKSCLAAWLAHRIGKVTIVMSGWAASRCFLAVSITRRIARRCWVMRIPRFARCASFRMRFLRPILANPQGTESVC